MHELERLPIKMYSTTDIIVRIYHFYNRANSFEMIFIHWLKHGDLL